MIKHLLEEGKEKDQIIEMNFEFMGFSLMSSKDVYDCVKRRIIEGKRAYLFFDEIQRIEGWENAINALRVEFDTDIYVTGSNAYLLSSEYSTYLAGRCIEINMLPISFKEFLYFHDFELKEIDGSFGARKFEIIDANDVHYSLEEAFNAYLCFWGMPGIRDAGLDQEKAFMILDGICNTVINRDILERERRRGLKAVTDALLLKKIIMFLSDNIGSIVSCFSIGGALTNSGILEDRSKKGVAAFIRLLDI